MALYQLKPQDPIEAAVYAPGLEDGFIGFTSDTIVTNPIPFYLEYYAGFYTTVSDEDDWVCNIPFVGDNDPVEPTDYIVTPDTDPKYKVGKAAFEAMYEIVAAP